ncbi:TetR/AcrR family transcriptional regulator [Streptomyces uncialis]|uniref:TetR/AcrR family transcriptional regulator n=1 Tax=Streptomyces uncialis TaxID=1048205 RepID=UPI0022593729|nr:TetR/AcrR family transcriptional regulator [Streptomyces uncialis]MCX4658665.1 TetR/AcrR family transcriptional regulator [Streptomyces uncialis]WTE14451.1 TetR/AcrR family transcriptional regulator [Streptomyces uncialis]
MESVGSKHVQRSQATRAALVAAARRLFGERGYANVGTEEIVRAAGVTRGALYHQFRDKTDLFDATVRTVEAEVTERIAARMRAGAADPVAALRTGARAFLDAFAEPDVERVLLLDAPGVLGWRRWREIGQEYGLGVITSALEAAMAAGVMTVQPVVPLAHLLLGALDEAALKAAHAEDPEAARTEMAEALDSLLTGLLVRADI